MAKKLSAMRWCIGQAVIESWTLWSTLGSTNRSVTRSLRQLQVQPLEGFQITDIISESKVKVKYTWNLAYNS